MSKNKSKGSYMPKSNPQKPIRVPVAQKMPPAMNRAIVAQTRIIASTLMGFYVEVVLYEHPDGKSDPMYFLQAEIEPLQSNIELYSYLKDFNIFYLHTHTLKNPGQITAFVHPVFAITDIAAAWAIYGVSNGQRHTDITALLRQGMNQSNIEMEKRIRQEIEKK